VADTQPFKSELLYDSVSVFPLGMNSGREPQSIPKDQLASAINCTVRFDFLTNRPPYTNQLTILWPSTAVQQAVEQGLFQGAGYYQPDSGNASLFASISGRLFQFTLNGNTVTVTEQTIPGDPNPASSTQAWIWQSENFLIVNDGISLPLFFDGVSTRRSYGPSVLLGTTDAGPYTVPAIGSAVNVTLLAPYTGPYNVPVLLHGEYYQPISSTGYLVNLTSLFSNAGEVIGVNEIISIRPSIAGVVANPLALAAGTPFDYLTMNLTITLTAPYTGLLNITGQGNSGKVILFGTVWFVSQQSGNNITVVSGQPGVLPATLASGTEIQYSSSIAPSVNVASVTVASVSPGIFGTVQLSVDSNFTGTPGQIVYLGTGQYTIVSVPPVPSGGNVVRLVNLSDTATTTIVSLPIVSVPELPPGRMGCYGLGQNWVCLVDGLTFIVGDISRGPSGTQANNWRDSVLKTTDLTFRGGNFSIPGAGNIISSMTFTANLDVTLGQGSLEVGTPGFIASCLAPIDFTNPPSNGPILTYSLVGSGPLAQNSTVRVNSDIFFRSVAGLGSLIRARRDFQTPGNTPISNEVMTFLDLDDKPLLPYGSSTVFNNRFLTTLSPQASSQGVLHAGLIALNLDPVSGMHDKQPPVYDGVWTGINALQLVTGMFSGTERCFAYTFNVALSKIELYELLPSDDNNFDNGVVPIVWTFETAMLFNKDVKRPDVMCSLRDGEFAVSDVTGNVRFEVYYKSDQGCWTPWHAFSICADPTGEPQYFPRLGLGEPDSKLCDPILNYPLRDGYMFQFRFVITGHCHFLRARFAAVTLPTPKFEPPICDVFATVTN